MPARQRKPWRRRLVLALLVLLALAAMLAALPQLVRPWLERAATAALATPVRIGWIHVSPLSGGVALHHVRAGEDDALTIARIAATPELGKLLHGEIVLDRIEISGLRGTVEQDAHGMPALRGLPLPESHGASGGPPVAVGEIELRDADLAAIPPRSLRKHAVAVHLDDLLLRQVPSSDAGASYQGELHGTLDGVPVTVTARAHHGPAGTRVEAEGTLSGATIDRDALVLPPGFDSLHATAGGRIAYALDPAEKRNQVTADLELADVRLAGADDTSLTAAGITIEGLAIDVTAGSADLGRITVRAPRISAALTPRGLVYPGLVPALVEAGVTTPASVPAHAAPAWRIVGGRIDASDGKITLRRDAHATTLELPSFSWRHVARGAAGGLRMTLRPAGGGAIAVTGRLGIEPASIDASIDVTSLALPEIAALVATPLALAQGTMSGHVGLHGDPAAPRIAANVTVDQLHTAPPDPAEKDRILAVDHLATRFTVAPGPGGAIDVTSLDLSFPYAMVQRARSGTFPLDVLTGSGNAPAAGATPAPGPARTVRIGTLTITGGRIDFVDETTDPPFWMGLASTEAHAQDVRVAPLELGELAVSGRQDELHPLRAAAQRTGSARWQGQATLEGLSLATLNPYLSPLLGYRADGGTVSVDLAATLDRNTLQATSALSLDDVEVVQTGLDVIQRQTGVPLNVGLALMKDVGGEIALSIPVTVDTATGKFELGSFVSEAIGRAVLGALSSPLRWLGMLFGTDGPPHALAIDPIPFRAGSATLDASGSARLTQVARILGAHADLDVILKAMIAPEDERAVGVDALPGLAQRRVDAVRGGFASGGGGTAIAASRLIVAPWTEPAGGKLDAAPGVYVEVQSP